MNDKDRTRVLDTACNVLAAAVPDVWAVYAYGSFARGDEWPDSDVDLAELRAPS